MKNYKKYVKAANMLLNALQRLKLQNHRQITQKLNELGIRHIDMLKYYRKYDMAVDKGWQSSSNKLRTMILRNTSELLQYLEQFKNSVGKMDYNLPNAGEIIAGLLQLDHEFADVKIKVEEKAISIITETIVLGDVPLGSFEVKLLIDQIENINSDSPYNIIALEPNPAASNCEVTHPHVSNGKLCEGDSFIPIRKAILQSRFCDFFQIVVHTLQTYNPHSPYVPLADWEGVSCYDCGYIVAGEDCYFCEDCQNDFCSSCSTYCQICDTTICLGCGYECPICRKPVCQNCTGVCAGCDDTFCEDCLEDESLCQKCQELLKEQENEENENKTATPKTDSSVQSNCMGQTHVSA